VKRVVIWLDDMRNPSYISNKDRIEAHMPEHDEVIWCKDHYSFNKHFRDCALNEEVHLVGICFDYFLNSNHVRGTDVLRLVERKVKKLDLSPFELYAQTGSSEGRKLLHEGFKSLREHWSQS